MNRTIAFILGVLAALMTLVGMSVLYVFIEVDGVFLRALSACISVSAGRAAYQYLVKRKA